MEATVTAIPSEKTGRFGKGTSLAARTLFVLALGALLGTGGAAGGSSDAAPAEMTLKGGRVHLAAPAAFGLAVSPQQLLAGGVIPPCSVGFDYCFYLPDEAFEESNFVSAGVTANLRDDLRSETSCLLAQPEGWSRLQPGIVQEESFSTARFGDVGQAAAGSFSRGEVLRLFDRPTGECWEFETRVAQTRYENYPPGAVDRFTEEQEAEVQDLFSSLLASVSINEAVDVVWPEEGTGDLSEFVRVDLPAVVESPLRLAGEARGTWFFEGSFPVRLETDSGEVIAHGFVTAQGDWMTEDFVPFEGELAFEVAEPTTAILVLARDNPSDLPEHDAALRVEVVLHPPAGTSGN